MNRPSELFFDFLLIFCTILHASTASIISKSELRIQNSEFRIQNSEFRIQSPFNLGTANSRTQNSELRTQNSELEEQGSRGGSMQGEQGEQSENQ